MVVSWGMVLDPATLRLQGVEKASAAAGSGRLRGCQVGHSSPKHDDVIVELSACPAPRDCFDPRTMELLKVVPGTVAGSTKLVKGSACGE
eukprot:gene51105-40147_t